jgi:GAF domain-containing protein
MVNMPVAEQAQTNAELRQQLAEALEREKAALKKLQDRDQQLAESANELQDCQRRLTEALEQQTATSEILRVIASSPTDLQPVLNAVAESAARLCDSVDAQIWRVEGDMQRKVASYGAVPSVLRVGETRPIRRGSASGRAILDRQIIHIHDILAEREEDYADVWRGRGARSEARTVLATPLLREGESIGCITIRRMETQPFNEKQIALLQTFADQAVIAIENVRLFKEIQERNAELHEALEHQTATSEVLGIISRSPTDVQPVLDAIVESAARVCGIDDVLLRLREGKTLVARAHFGPMPIGRVEINAGEPHFRWMREHGTLHIPDVHAQNDFLQTGFYRSSRTWLAVPLRQQGEFIGTLAARRIEVRPFTPAQIKLLETFADQAVIAIENVRLFNELKESLEQQTATSEILGVIASSPTDIQPVLDTVAANASRLCEATDAQIRLVEGDGTRLVASFGSLPAPEFRPRLLESPTGRALLKRETVHVHDLQEAMKTEFPDSQALASLGTRDISRYANAPRGNSHWSD